MCDFKGLRRLRSIGPQPRAGSGLQDRLPSACPILVGWVPTAMAAKFFGASYWNSSLKQALSAPACRAVQGRPHPSGRASIAWPRGADRDRRSRRLGSRSQGPWKGSVLTRGGASGCGWSTRARQRGAHDVAARAGYAAALAMVAPAAFQFQASSYSSRLTGGRGETLVQSRPSTSIENCAAVSRTTPPWI